MTEPRSAHCERVVEIDARLLREAAELLEDIGTADYVNPPTADAMQCAAAEIRAALDQKENVRERSDNR